MKKRNYLKSLPLLALAFLLVFGFNSCQAPPADKNIGLQLWSVKDDMGKDAKATIEAVGAMGYKFVETAGYGDGKLYGMEPVAFKELCETNGLKVLGAHCGQVVPDETNWDETMAWWDKCIETNSAAGVKWIVQPFMGNVGYESLEGLQRYCDYFNAVGEKCNAKGIRFGYHNHDNEFKELEGEIIYDYMVKNTDPEKVMFQLDLYWIIEGGKKPVDYFNKYPGRFELWHIKDKAEVGASGQIDFAAIFEGKEASGMKYSVVEVEEYNFEPLESCKKSIEFLNAAEYVKL